MIENDLEISVEYGAAQIDQQHLLYALLNQEGGLIPQLMKKLHIDAARMSASCEREIQRIPKVNGPGREPDKVYISQAVEAALQEAESQAQAMLDAGADRIGASALVELMK